MAGVRSWLSLTVLAALAGAQEAPPVLVYDFGSPAPSGLLRDLSGGRSHARLPAGLGTVPCPTGQAAEFDGATCVSTGSATRLVMRDRLTLDLWLRYDATEAQGCVLDKQGEVYRVAVEPGGRFYVGLKGEGSRTDLRASGLLAGQWQRITATFQRPELVLYLDRKEVGRTVWDHAIGPGGPLHVGAKSGRYDFYKGAIDQVHIYDYARAPRAGDETRYLAAGGEAVKAELRVTRADGTVTVDTGPMTVTVDETQAIVREVRAGAKTLVRGNALPPLAATLLESATYDGVRDVSPDRFVDAVWECDGMRLTQTTEAAELAAMGGLRFPGDDRLGVTLTYRVERGQRRLQVQLAVNPTGSFRSRFVRSLAVVLPLSLGERKRVVLAGDQGVREDVRCRYDFHTHVRFLEQPDHNDWRHFGVDQNAPGSFALWRSESWETPRLTGFRGRQAPGWMTVYDREGGVSLAYHGMGQRAPKSLYANAEAGGTGTVYLQAPTHPAASPRPDRSPALFGQPHRLDWVFFEGEECIEQPERDLEAAWRAAGLAVTSPDPGLSGDPQRWPRLDTVTPMWSQAGASPAALSPIVEGGFPLPRGVVTRPDQIRLFAGDAEVPLDARPLAYWPDQSIKWLLLLFPLRLGESPRSAAGSGTGQEAQFAVTTRAEVAGSDRYRLVFGPEVRRGALAAGVRVAAGEEGVDLDTGPLQLRLRKGQEWLAGVRVNGREVVRCDGRAQAFVDFLRPGAAQYATGTTHPLGQEDPGPVSITRVDVEEQDGLRAVVRLEGEARCAEPARVILRLEVWAGRPFVKLTHTVEFLHADPRVAFVRRMGLRLPLGLQPAATRCLVGGQSSAGYLPDADSVGLLQTDHLGSKVWLNRPGERWPEVVEQGAQSQGWLHLRDETVGVCLVQRDLWQEAPKELRYERSGHALEVLYWPDSVPLMDCRRYSLYPHQAQGESTPADQRWVLDNYYRNDPFKGVSKSHETWLVFHDPQTSPETVRAVAADIQSRPLVYAGWPWYARTGVTMPLAPVDAERFRRVNAATLDLADWWLFHQRAWGWYGMWDYGDVQHHYRDGYGRVFPPEVLARILALPAEQRAAVVPGSEYSAVQDYFTQNDWAYDNGRWGWSNTEGLVNHFMSLCYLRSGRRDLFFFIEANARHARDVDARHAGKWFGLGTRHGVQHWSDGNHEERQTTFTEQRFHYLLTGEPRTREWNRELTDRWYLRTPCSVHAAHSGRSYGLLTCWEISGDPELGRVLRDYMRVLATPAGIAISTPVGFPEGKATGAAKGLNEANMFFHTFGAMHAMLEYVYLTGDEQVAASIIRTADAALQGGPRAVGDMLRKAVAFAARQAPDPKPYREALAQWCADAGARYAYQQVTHNPDHWSGETSFLVGNVSGGLFWASDALYVLGAFDVEPSPEAQVAAEMEARERQPRQPRPALPRGSWQDEYDRPEFREYLRDRLGGTP